MMTMKAVRVKVIRTIAFGVVAMEAIVISIIANRNTAVVAVYHPNDSYKNHGK